jgi:hypothetical protein
MIDKQKESLELRKLYLVQFEKFETKVFLSWMSVVLTLFIGWILGEVSNCLMLIVALFTGFLDWFLEKSRKDKFDKLIKEINSGNVGGIK